MYLRAIQFVNLDLTLGLHYQYLWLQSQLTLTTFPPTFIKTAAYFQEFLTHFLIPRLKTFYTSNKRTILKLTSLGK